MEKIRNNNKIYEFINIINSDTKLPSQVQAIMNYVFYPKIGILPSKFGIWNFRDIKDIKQYISHLRTKLDINELEESYLKPSIIHNVLCWPKIWSPSTKYSGVIDSCDENKGKLLL